MMSLKNPTLRRRTEEFTSIAEDWDKAYHFGYELINVGRLVKDMASHIYDLQSKVDSQAEHIKGLNEQLENARREVRRLNKDLKEAESVIPMV